MNVRHLVAVVLAAVISTIPFVQVRATEISFENYLTIGEGVATGTDFQSQGLIMTASGLGFDVGCGAPKTCLGADQTSPGDFNGTITGTFVLPNTTTPTVVTDLVLDNCCFINTGLSVINFYDALGNLVATSTGSSPAYSGPVASFSDSFSDDALYDIRFDSPSSSPEPGALVLLGSGLATLALVRRARQA